jgi:uncharacterized protein YndB with AHSA1/START domain
VTSVSVTQQTSASIGTVWQKATDIAASPQWLTGVDSVRLLAGGDEFGVGTRWDETRTLMGRQATEQMVVTAVAPGVSFTVEAESDGVHYVSLFEFTPNNAGTTIRLTFGAEGGGLLAKIMAPLSSRIVARQLRQDIRDLARVAEAEER